MGAGEEQVRRQGEAEVGHSRGSRGSSLLCFMEHVAAGGSSSCALVVCRAGSFLDACAVMPSLDSFSPRHREAKQDL